MDPLDEQVHQLFERLHSLAAGFASTEQQPKQFGTGHPLSRAEIHLVSAIAERPRIGVTELAERQGVTKGAISQLVSRLESKGLVERGEREGRAFPLRVTALGAIAHAEHQRFHQRLFAALADVYDAPGQVQADLDALERLSEALQRFVSAESARPTSE